MASATAYHTSRNCMFDLHGRLVFTTKYRRRVFDGQHIATLRTIFSTVCADYGATLSEMDGEADHVHLLVNYPPRLEVSKLVNRHKGVSSRVLREEHPEIATRYWKSLLWSRNYFAASCGGAPISIIRQYIEQQRTPE